MFFPIAFLAACVACGIFTGYILYLNPKGTLNRLFGIVCALICAWSLGFGMSSGAADLQASLPWQRVAAVGWGCGYSVLLHFVLVMTGRDSLIKKRWIPVVLYAPAVLNLFLFVVPNPLNPQPFDMALTDYGWVNICGNLWMTYFNIYYIAVMTIVFVLVWRWRKTSNEARIQAKLFFASWLAAGVAATVTDTILSKYAHILFPQMAPVILIFPLAVIYYAIRQYGFLKPGFHAGEQILDSHARRRVYAYLSAAYIAGAALFFFTETLLYAYWDFGTIAMFTLLLLSFGAGIQVVQRLKIQESVKDIINICLIALSIPSVTLNFVQFASVTIWAFPAIIIVFALVFNKRYVLMILSASIVLTQFFVWSRASSVAVSLDYIDYLERIGIFGISLCMAFYVNRVYVARLKENTRQTRMQKLISQISSDFVTVNAASLEEKIKTALENAGCYLQADHSYVVLFDRSCEGMTDLYEWCKDEENPGTGLFSNDILEQFPWLVKQIRQNRAVRFSAVEGFPLQAAREKEALEKKKIGSLLAMPICSKDTPLGFISFACATSNRVWQGDYTVFVELLSNIISDAFIQVEAEKEINNMAFYDHLTKLPNRLMFNDRVNQAIALANRTERQIGVMFLDLDSFKNVNDTMGHEGGDELLKNVSVSLMQNVRKTDTVSRFGGDEFLIMLNQIENEKDMILIADNIMRIFNRPFIVNGQEFYITVSAGIALFPDDGEDTESLIKNADIAMYTAKAKGKNQYVLCTKDMKEETHHKMMIVNHMYHALARDEMMVYYQPQVNLVTGQIIGLEALLRWKQPELGMIPPATFIPLSEQTGLINSIGEWVLKSACRQNKEWQDKGLPPLRMSVNVSVNQFRNPDLVYQVKKTLVETGLDPQYLELEVTENVAINEPNYIIEVMNNLKKLGIHIAIDDFGTEYSSLSRLKMLPIDHLKMDIQFVHGIDGDAKDQAITKVIINLAKNLGIKVIAEGVETEHQLSFLSQRMCDEVQGFYYYKPLPASELEPILRRGTVTTVTG